MADSNNMFEDADPMFAAFSSIPEESFEMFDLFEGFTELFLGEDRCALS